MSAFQGVRGGALWQGKSGFSLECWALWKEWLAEISRRVYINEEGD